MSATSENDHVTYKQVRELADKILKDAQDVADRAHEEIRKDIALLRGSLTTYIDERRVQDLARIASDKIEEGNVTEYRLRTEGRISKLEANQYVQVGLLAITIIASAVGLFRLFAGH